MRQLENLKKRLGNYKSWKVELVLDLHSRVENFEYVYLELLQEKFPDKIASLSISFLDFGELITNIESKQISNDVRKKIEKYYTSLLVQHELVSAQVNWSEEGLDLPSSAAMLKHLKINQPVTLKQYVDTFAGEYSMLNKKWLAKKFDGLRKKGFLVRGADTKYRLSLKGIEVVPAYPSRTSSDILRALALGKKKW